MNGKLILLSLTLLFSKVSFAERSLLEATRDADLICTSTIERYPGNTDDLRYFFTNLHKQIQLNGRVATLFAADLFVKSRGSGSHLWNNMAGISSVVTAISLNHVVVFQLLHNGVRPAKSIVVEGLGNANPGSPLNATLIDGNMKSALVCYAQNN